MLRIDAPDNASLGNVSLLQSADEISVAARKTRTESCRPDVCVAMLRPPHSSPTLLSGTFLNCTLYPT